VAFFSQPFEVSNLISLLPFLLYRERQLRLFDTARCAVFVHRKETAKCFASDKKEARKKGCTATIQFLSTASDWWTSVCDCKKPKSALKAAALLASQPPSEPTTDPNRATESSAAE
jgi:hypothetical protein